MHAPSTRVVVLGSINMDLTVRSPHLPAPGETLLGSSFTTSPGGKGANQAVAAARAGASVTFLGAVGDDEFGHALRRTLTDSAVDDSGLHTVHGASGIAVITVDDSGENNIVVVPGANAEVIDLDTAALEIIASADILLCQLEIPISTVIDAFLHAHANGVVTMLNPSPVQHLPAALVAATDVLIVNESEEKGIGVDASTVAHLITTLGAAGARYRGAESFGVPAPAVTAVDTTGAGDAFAGALAAVWSTGPRDAVTFACAAGALAATRPGASASSGTRAEIVELSDRSSDKR